jgi:hypothetical protein
MITVSPNRVGKFAQCPAICGYTYVTGEKRETQGVALVRGRKRGKAIHAATLGAPPETTAPNAPATQELLGGMAWTAENVDPGAVPTPPSYAHSNTEYSPAAAEWDARILWVVLNHYWPGAEWYKEQELTTQLTPGVQLQGRLDLWGHCGGALILPDLKTSTAFRTTQLTTYADDFDRQLVLYARLLRDHVGDGRLPQLWRLGYNPTTKQAHRRQYTLSEELIEQASRYAVHVGCAIERMHMMDPLEWLRTFSCNSPFPCAYKGLCARDTGAWYTDGKAPLKDPIAATPDTADVRPFFSPVDVTLGPIKR